MKLKKFIAGILCLAIAVMSVPLSSITFSVNSAYATEIAYLDDDVKKTKIYADNVAALVNDLRAENGLEPLEVIPLLQENAQLRAVEISDVFEHTRPDGSKCFTAISSSISYSYVGENIAYGNSTPEKTVNQWNNSSGHRANMLSSNFTHIGVGVYKSGGTYYWTQLFIQASGTVSDAYTPVYQEYLPATTALTTTIKTTAKPVTTTVKTTTKPTTTTLKTTAKPVTTTKKATTKYIAQTTALYTTAAKTTTNAGVSIVETGSCGKNVTYTLDSNGLLTISGTGNMTDYKSYSNSPFYNNGNISSVVVEDGVTSIGNYAFCDCTIRRITIPDSVTSIGYSAFFECESLTSITIPDSVTSIGDYAFIWCTNLTSITIGDSVTSIGESAFSCCYSLTSIEVDENNQYYKSIDGNLYNKDATELIQYAIGKTEESFTIPDSVTSIGSSAFYYCTSLTSITIPDSVTSISDYAFSHCKSLTSITIPDSVTSIGFGAFSNCKSLTSITISDSVTSIGSSAFYYCTSLTSITIPDSITSIGDSAFFECESLTSITIPDSITSIGGHAFYDCISLTSITIPDSVTSIDRYAFYECTSLTSISIPDSVTSIGNDAFSHCDSLTSITIPDSVTSIGSYAFYDCYSLTDVYYNGTETRWNNISIGDYNSCLTNATIHFIDTPEETTAPVTITTKITTTTFKTTVKYIAQTTALYTTTAKTTTSVQETEPQTETTDSVMFCDTNQDGEINISDAVYLNKYLVNAASLTKNGLQAADCYRDGSVDSNDTLVILKYLVMTYTYSDLPVYPS